MTYICPEKNKTVVVVLNNTNFVDDGCGYDGEMCPSPAIEVQCPECREFHIFDGTNDDV